jgi:general secretion pathway protein E
MMIASIRQSARLDPDVIKPAQGTATFRSASGPVTVRVRSERPREAADATAGAASGRLVLELCHARGLTGIADLGYSIGEQQRMRALLAETGGLVVVTGPLGAGKTATLYAMARELSQRGRLVSTVEEAIAYPLAGVTQHQLGSVRTRSLGAALRSAAGMTEDIVSSAVIADATLDAATFEECASAAGRGQLVVATLVAPDLTSAFAHLRAVHSDGGTVAAALRGVVVQRLLRRLCEACATPQLESELPELERSLLASMAGGNVRRPVGCKECHGTGYRGRLAIVEVVAVTETLRQAIARRAIAAELMQVVRGQGAPSLWDSGIEHVRAGATSLAELLDTVPPPDSGTGASHDFDALLSEALAKTQSRRVSPKKKSTD